MEKRFVQVSINPVRHVAGRRIAADWPAKKNRTELSRPRRKFYLFSLKRDPEIIDSDDGKRFGNSDI